MVQHVSIKLVRTAAAVFLGITEQTVKMVRDFFKKISHRLGIPKPRLRISQTGITLKT